MHRKKPGGAHALPGFLFQRRGLLEIQREQFVIPAQAGVMNTDRIEVGVQGFPAYGGLAA